MKVSPVMKITKANLLLRYRSMYGRRKKKKIRGNGFQTIYERKIRAYLSG